MCARQVLTNVLTVFRHFGKKFMILTMTMLFCILVLIFDSVGYYNFLKKKGKVKNGLFHWHELFAK